MHNSISHFKRALEFAKHAHAGQLRAIGPDTGKSYFDTHVLRVVAAVPQYAKAAAALHDVVEDVAGVWQEDIDKLFAKPTAGTVSVTAEAVRLLTRPEEMNYFDYIGRMCSLLGERNIAQRHAHRIALAVKLADLADNLATLPEGSLRRRYIRAMSLVSPKLYALGDPTNAQLELH